ncbi:helix-turn-helix domain-containing protein [Azotobacter chroococcum]|nr:helix-turn-helix domain-containing protein [Azotobacter chroococcum]
MALPSLSLIEFLTPLYPPTLTVRQVSEITSENEQTIRNAISQGTYPIPSFKLGSKRLFRLLDVASYIDELCAKDPSNPANQRRKRGRPTKVEQQAALLAQTPIAGKGQQNMAQG